MSIQALVFDAYGTLFDVHSIAAHCERTFRTDGQAMSRLWRARQLEYTWLASLMGRYRDFWDITQDALVHACEVLALDAAPQKIASAMDAYLALAPHADVPAALTALRGRPLAILSNGSPRMLDPLLDNARLRDAFSAVLSVDSVGIYKPSPKVYALATQALRLQPQEVGFVSSNFWDIAGATSFGFQTFWLNRFSAVPDRLGFQPRATLTGLGELALSPLFEKSG